MDNFTDTIVASATPPGVGGVGIVRLSGKLTENIARTTEFSIQRSREKFQRLNDRTQMAVRGNGWLATTGTPLKMLLQNAMNFEEDVAAQRLQSETKRLEQFEIATNQRLQGQLQRMQGKAAREISKTQAVGTLLSGGSQSYATYKMA